MSRRNTRFNIVPVEPNSSGVTPKGNSIGNAFDKIRARSLNSLMGVDSTVARTVVVFDSTGVVDGVVVLSLVCVVVAVFTVVVPPVDTLAVTPAVVVVCDRSRDCSPDRADTPSAIATNEVTKFVSGFDTSIGDIVDITTPKSAVVGASYTQQTTQNDGNCDKYFYTQPDQHTRALSCFTVQEGSHCSDTSDRTFASCSVARRSLNIATSR